MTLKMFLGTASDLDYVRVIDGWRSEDNLLYDGDYKGFAQVMLEQGWADAYIMRWSVIDRVATIELSFGCV